MQWPQLGEELTNSKFVRVLEYVGLSLDMPSFEHASDTTATKNGDNWSLNAPEIVYRDTGLIKRIIRSFRLFIRQYKSTLDEAEAQDGLPPVLSTVLFAVIAPICVISALIELPNGNGADGASLYLAGLLGCLMWITLLIYIISPF